MGGAGEFYCSWMQQGAAKYSWADMDAAECSWMQLGIQLGRHETVRVRSAVDEAMIKDNQLVHWFEGEKEGDEG